jgi:hypothetical protein
MKFRIVKRYDGSFEVHKKSDMFSGWQKEKIYKWDVSEKDITKVSQDGSTPYLFLAQEVMKNKVKQIKERKIKKEFQIIEEVKI